MGTAFYKQGSGVPVELTMSEGSFIWMWEVVEAQARRQYHTYKDVLPDLTDVIVDVLSSVRSAGHEAFPSTKPEPPKKKRKKRRTESKEKAAGGSTKRSTAPKHLREPERVKRRKKRKPA